MLGYAGGATSDQRGPLMAWAPCIVVSTLARKRLRAGVILARICEGLLLSETGCH
jgi:hypothetical protein